MLVSLVANWFHTDPLDTYDGQWHRVARVIDGDTIVLADETRVRLIGVDTPERGKAWFDEATDALREKLSGGRVLLKLGEGRPRDKYGRLLAYLHTDAGDVNRQLIAEGHGWAYRPIAHTFERDYEAAETAARRRARGLWAVVPDEDQPEWRQKWLAEERAAWPLRR